MTVHFVHLLEDLRRRSLRMAALVEDMLDEACESVFAHDNRLAKRVVKRDEEVDREEVEVEAEAIRLMALYQPVGSDLRLLCTVLKVNNDLERIADCAVNIAERASHLDGESLPPESEALREMSPVVQRILRNAARSYGEEDVHLAETVLSDDNLVDALYSKFIREIIANATGHPEALSAQLDILSVAKNLERIADHATNIAEDVVFLSTGQIVRHKDTD
jgi:phosphate transport system protein